MSDRSKRALARKRLAKMAEEFQRKNAGRAWSVRVYVELMTKTIEIYEDTMKESK